MSGCVTWTFLVILLLENGLCHPGPVSSRFTLVGNNTVSFSVAPQPVAIPQANLEARDQFLLTYQLINQALEKRAKVLGLKHTNAQVAQTQRHAAELQQAQHGATKAPHALSQPSIQTHPQEEEINHNELEEEGFEPPEVSILDPVPPQLVRPFPKTIFPDRKKSPEYFLSGLDIDSDFLQSLDVDIEDEAPILNVTSLGENNDGKKCYEIIYLTEEEEFFTQHRFAKSPISIGKPVILNKLTDANFVNFRSDNQRDPFIANTGIAIAQAILKTRPQPILRDPLSLLPRAKRRTSS